MRFDLNVRDDGGLVPIRVDGFEHRPARRVSLGEADRGAGGSIASPEFGGVAPGRLGESPI
jgi:hypothetical protein